MREHTSCPRCDATVPPESPGGLCPACALGAGIDTLGGPDSPTQTGGTRRRAQPMPPEELAAKLPELEQFEPLGRGGMGTVYRARHRKLDRPVAVKVLDASLLADPAFAERFTREARTLARLDHPNIVAVYDFGYRNDVYYLVMELVDGVNLRQAIDAGGIEPREALAMIPHICEALQYAHDQGVVHRDVKPENILIDRSGTIKIADFGLAKLMDTGGDSRLTQTRQVMGTPNYMAPEQIEHPGDVDHRADIFALGVVLYELLTGELPLGRFPLPSKKVEVDVRLDEVVLRTLEKEPGLRYQRVSELQSDVESLSWERPAGAPPGVPVRSPDGRGYEYRSSTTVMGWPLVHIAFSGDDSGRKVRVARGVVAIGDVAVGAVACGGLSFGGIAFGGLGVGLVSFGGVVLGLLAAMGGVAAGCFSFGGVAIGVLARGGLPLALLSSSGTTIAVLVLWAALSLAFTVGAIAVVTAWTLSRRREKERAARF